MKAIAESIRYYIHEGMTSFQAENYVCQRIVLSKISKSPFADKVLIKGGVVANCLDLLTFENKRGIASLEEVRESVETALTDAAFQRRLSKVRERWIDVGIDAIADEIVAFLYDL